MMNNPTILPGALVQFEPHHEWAGAVAIVDEVKTWGLVVYVVVPRQGLAYNRVKVEDVSRVGETRYEIKKEVSDG